MKTAFIVLLAIVSLSAQGRTRPKTIVSCISPVEKDISLEVYLAPRENNLSWETIIEVEQDGEKVVEDRDLQVSYDGAGDLYKGKQLTLRVRLLEDGRLFGKLSGAGDQLPTNFHCQKLR